MQKKLHIQFVTQFHWIPSNSLNLENWDKVGLHLQIGTTSESLMFIFLKKQWSKNGKNVIDITNGIIVYNQYKVLRNYNG